MASSTAALPGQANQAMRYVQHLSTLSSPPDAVTIETLPAELVNEIITHLRPHDLTKVARVSKKYREFAQSALWRSIELHRQDAHHACFGLTSQKNVARTYLDDRLRHLWSYRLSNGTDPDFDRRNAKFGTVIRNLYRSAGKSQAWSRLAPFLRHLCLTVTHRSPPHIWNMILSLPNLNSVEVIGEYSESFQAPPALTIIRQPAANKVCNVRLRGCIPGGFISAICQASASTITSLDLGVLERPQVFEDETDQHSSWVTLYVAPRGTLWFHAAPQPSLSSLTHLLLCKRGAFETPHLEDMPEEDEWEFHEDRVHEEKDIKQWASILQSVRSTVVEIILEERPIHVAEVTDMGISEDSETYFVPGANNVDPLLYHHIFKVVFDDGNDWPKLQKLVLRGVNLNGFSEKAGESWSSFTARALPGVLVEQIDGNYMFFMPRCGTILNQHGADGLKQQLDSSYHHYYDHI